MTLKLVEGTVPALLVTVAGLLVVQTRMGEGNFGAPLQWDEDRSRQAIRLDLPRPASRQLIDNRLGFTTSRYSPLLSCSVPSSMRKRTRKRPSARRSISANGTGPASGPHQKQRPRAS